MSNFKLGIDYPYDVSQTVEIYAKPEPLRYPTNRTPVRHCGSMMFEIFEKLETMKPGDERDELVRVTANQMERNLMQWGHSSSDGEKIALDLEESTDDRIALDLDTFKFDRMDTRPNERRKERR